MQKCVILCMCVRVRGVYVY